MTLHVVVVGAGVVGLCLAESLAGRGATVDLVEAERPGAGATSRSFAWINATLDKQPREYFELSRDAVETWRRWSEDDPELGVRWVRSVEWASEDQAPRLRAAVERHRRLGAETRAIEPSRLRELEPAVDSSDAAASCVTEGEAVVDPPRLVARLVARVRERGVAVHERTRLDRCRQESFDGGRRIVCEVVGQGAPGSLTCDAVVLTAGVATEELARLHGEVVPLVDSPGVLVRLDQGGSVPRGVVLSPDVHFRSLGEGELLVGPDFGGGELTEAPERVVEKVAERVAARLGGTGAVVDWSLGRRPMPRDGLPVVGRVGSSEWLYVAVMHSGVTLAPLIAERLSEEIVGGVRDPRLEPFRPERFAAPDESPEETAT